jgi:putative oxidoreductase
MTAKSRNIFTWVLAGLLAFAFLGAGLSKLIGAEMQIKNLESWGYPLWMRFPIGLSEILFAIGLLIPAYRKLIVFGVFGWGLIAIYTHIQAIPPQTQMLAGPIVFLLLNTALFFLSKANSKSLN